MTNPERRDKRYKRLREGFRSSFPWNNETLTRDAFRDWARKKEEGPINVPAHAWRPMREGEPVLQEIIEVFSEYIAFMHYIPTAQCRVSVIAEPCEPLDKAGKKATRLRDTWTVGWGELLAIIIGKDGIEDDATCANEDDLTYASDMIYECIGWHDKRLSGSNALSYGESVLKRPPADYARFLQTLWQANENTVLFPTQRLGGSVQRIGVNVMVPVTEAFYRRFREGLAVDFDLTPQDMPLTSPFVLAHAAAENVGIDMKRGKAARSLNHMRSLLYQLAALFAPVDINGSEPHIITHAGTKENGKRLRAYGFTPTGAKHSLNGIEIMEFKPPKDVHGFPRVKALADYMPMKGLIQVFQAYILAVRSQQD